MLTRSNMNNIIINHDQKLSWAKCMFIFLLSLCLNFQEGIFFLTQMNVSSLLNTLFALVILIWHQKVHTIQR